MALTYSERQAHWEWCRDYIDRECIWRASPELPNIPGKAPGSTYVWQFYLRRATFNCDFAHRLGLLFWDRFLNEYRRQPFQICACEPSGPPIANAISNAGLAHDINLNVFGIRREMKQFGIDNWFDGTIRRDQPVMLVDDAAASAVHLPLAAARVQQKLRLPLHQNYFAIVNKVGRSFLKNAQHTENYLDNELVALFTVNNFCQNVDSYLERYGALPRWTGLVK